MSGSSDKARPIARGFVLGPLTPREVTSVMMFLNHSCEPNVGIRGQIVFVAMRAIHAGEELTIDYDDVWRESPADAL